ncbi:U3 snoRNP protein [Coemansia sp. BCRC 34301]|nr:U3 snoRNP protein [Coemansia sp. BCRC 34301]
MAEVVQYHLEQMLSELEDLSRLKLFTKSELKTIVKKRTKYEYTLRRRRVQGTDFLRYIAYEINVDALRRKRKSKVASDRSLSDYSIGRRIVSLFERALTRHANDIGLWLQYIEYVRDSDHSEDKEEARTALARIYASAITRHPYDSRLWVMAAAHELEASSNGNAARLLLQRALRVNPKDQALWLAYFRLELQLVDKIKARRRVLGIDGGRKEEEEEEGAVIALPTLDEEAEFDMRVEDRVMAQYASAQKGTLHDDTEYMQGAVAVIVFDQAIRAIPAPWHFRRQLADAATGFPLVIQHALDSIRADFASDASARAFLCAVPLSTVSMQSPDVVDAARSAQSLFDQTLADVDTPAMWAEYSRFLAKNRAGVLKDYYGALLRRAATRVSEDPSRLDGDVALLLADWAPDRSVWLAMATVRFPQSEHLWAMRVSCAVEGGDPAAIRSTADQALGSAPHARSVWDQWLEWVERSLPPASVHAEYISACARTSQLTSQHLELKTHIQARFVDWAVAFSGDGAKERNLDRLRAAYRDVVRNAYPTPGFYARCLALEPDLDHSRSLHEMACRLNESDPEPWLAYLKFLVANGKLDQAASIFWRATNALPTDRRSAFDTAYQSIR